MKERKADQDCYDFTLVQRVVLLKPPPQGRFTDLFRSFIIVFENAGPQNPDNTPNRR